MKDEIIKKLWACHYQMCDLITMTEAVEDMNTLAKIAADLKEMVERIPGGTVNPFIKVKP